ncbi:hypothetical protein N798_16605 [Knoellia flava TL1]|uniref:Uncharacterized protein n=2 Tax=Knoellia flava TaxID=913969 RepID=A0A8H9KQA5_9MICO|nr:hypothetical protein [Knoellia flava]KGN28936.1 hypothetical protein N798_16605 [Knoellia flava TL1]GGB71533.1 hypothetical protein GCM10011314_08630 [Knoellia flava]
MGVDVEVEPQRGGNGPRRIDQPLVPETATILLTAARCATSSSGCPSRPADARLASDLQQSSAAMVLNPLAGKAYLDAPLDVQRAVLRSAMKR